MLLPAIFATALTTTLAAAAFRFLRPLAAQAQLGAINDSAWTSVAPVADLNGSRPLLRKISVVHQAGWSTMQREHTVYVQPQPTLRVVLAVCPHEGCEVDWNDATREFLCPCHDSHFNLAGTRLSGPARNDLTVLPARINNNLLEVRYQPAKLESEHPNTTERG